MSIGSITCEELGTPVFEDCVELADAILDSGKYFLVGEVLIDLLSLFQNTPIHEASVRKYRSIFIFKSL